MSFRTVEGSVRVEHVVSKSRFIGHCRPVSTEADALDHIAAIRKEYPDATHNCYAYRIRENSIARYSDDGEPGGTAGMPMMETLCAMDVADVSVVVTRYFGGVLLGSGGLVRAYSKTAAAAVKAATPVTMVQTRRYSLQAPYPLFDRLVSYLGSRSYAVGGQSFTDVVLVEAYVPLDDADGFEKALRDQFKDAIKATPLGAEYRQFKLE